MNILIEISLLFIVLIILIIVLMRSAKQVESNLITVSRKAKLKEFFLGFVFIGLFTNLPEVVIAFISSTQVPDLSVGNLFGGAAVLSSLVLGIVVVKFGTIRFKSQNFSENELMIGLLQLFVAMIFISDGQLTIIESIFLLLIYFLYIRYISHHFKIYLRQILNFNIFLFFKKVPFRMTLTTLFSIFMLVISANFIVEISSILATKLNIPVSILGLFLLGIGTNIPEIAILFTASKDHIREKNLTVGIVLGSIFIRTGILGLLGIFSGGFVLQNKIVLIPTIIILTITTIMFFIFTWKDKNVSKQEGFLLISLYISLIIAEFIIIINHLY